MIDLILNYLEASSSITIGILILLSIYLVMTFWIYVFKILQLSSIIHTEKNTLDALMIGETYIHPQCALSNCMHSNISNTKENLEVCEISLVREASSGLSWLSVISSTSPFIGLFGTVVGILESFAKFAGAGKVSFATIAPVISEALIATAAGIFVAIFAYTFHQFLVRKVYILNTYIKSQINIISQKS